MFHATLGIDGDSIEPGPSGAGWKIAVFLSGAAGVSCHREQRSAFQSGILRRMAGRTDLQRGAGAVPTRIPVSAPASVAGGECCEGGLSGSVCVVAPGQMCNGTWNEPGQRTKHAGRSVPFLCRSGGSGSVLLVLCRRVSSLPFGGADRKHGTGHLPRGCGADP